MLSSLTMRIRLLVGAIVPAAALGAATYLLRSGTPDHAGLATALAGAGVVASLGLAGSAARTIAGLRREVEAEKRTIDAVVIVARRMRGLADQQVQHLAGPEAGADILDRLVKVDQLAHRMRRNAESVLRVALGREAVATAAGPGPATISPPPAPSAPTESGSRPPEPPSFVGPPFARAPAVREPDWPGLAPAWWASALDAAVDTTAAVLDLPAGEVPAAEPATAEPPPAALDGPPPPAPEPPPSIRPTPLVRPIRFASSSSPTLGGASPAPSAEAKEDEYRRRLERATAAGLVRRVPKT